MARSGIVDGMRGWAILLIMYHHGLSFLAPSGLHAFPVHKFLFLFPLAPLSNARLGVAATDLLSGFCLLRATSGAASRFLRLATPFWFMLVVHGSYLFLGDLAGHEYTLLLALAKSALFLSQLDKDSFFPRFNWTAWSIPNDVAMVFLKAPLARAVQFGPGLAAAAACLWSAAVRYRAQTAEWPDIHEPFVNQLADSIIGRIDGYVLGMAVAAYYNRPGRKMPSAALALTCSLLGLLLFWLGANVWDHVFHKLVDRRASIAGDALCRIGLAVGIWGAVHLPRAVAWIAFPPPVQLLGRMALSLALFHGVPIYTVVMRLNQQKPADTRAEHYVIWFVLVFTLAAFVHRFIERRREDSLRKIFLGFNADPPPLARPLAPPVAPEEKDK